MIVTRNTIYCKKGTRRELIEMYKPFKDVPGMKIRILVPQCGPQDRLVVEMKWESHAAREAFFKSPPWEASAASEWFTKKRELVERGDDAEFYQVVELG